VSYLKETFYYLKKSWWVLALIFLPAAVALGFFIRPMASLSFLPVYAEGHIYGFTDVMLTVLNPYMIKTVWPIFLIFVLLFFTFCLGMPFIEKHFRSGKMTGSKPFSLANNYFIPTLKVSLIIGAIIVLYFTLHIALISMLDFILSGSGGVTSIAAVIVSSVFSLGFFTLMCWLLTPFVFMIPLMQMYGYSFGDAFRSSVSYCGEKPFKATMGFWLVFIIVAALRMVASAFERFIPSYALIIISSVLHLFLLVYFCAYTMVTTFSASGMERKDIIKYAPLP
jgi:hypothetical protein